MAACVLLALPAAWFLRSDIDAFSAQGPILYLRVAARVALMTTALAVFVALARASTRSAYSRTVFAAALVSSLAYLALYLPRVEGVPWRIRPVAIAVMYFAMPNTLWRQAVPPILLSAGLAMSLLLQPGSGVSTDLMALAVVNAAGFLVVVRRHQLESDVTAAWHKLRIAHQEAEAATRELRTLKGIIPLCSHCKNVRTEVGDWQAIEEYVRRHSSADFSHGICPDCLAEHYTKSAINA